MIRRQVESFLLLVGEERFGPFDQVIAGSGREDGIEEWKEEGRNDWLRSVTGRSKGSASKWEGEEEAGGKGDGGGEGRRYILRK
jgi:hypothetical protein